MKTKEELRAEYLRGMLARCLDLSFFSNIEKENFHDKIEYLAFFAIGALDKFEDKFEAAQPKPDVGDEDAAHEYYNREDKDCDDDEVAFMEGAKHGRAQERVNTERVERDKASNDRDYLEQAVRLAKAEARIAKLEEALKSIQNRYGDFPYAKDIRKVALEALLEDLKGAGVSSKEVK